MEHSPVSSATEHGRRQYCQYFPVKSLQFLRHLWLSSSFNFSSVGIPEWRTCSANHLFSQIQSEAVNTFPSFLLWYMNKASFCFQVKVNFFWVLIQLRSNCKYFYSITLCNFHQTQHHRISMEFLNNLVWSPNGHEYNVFLVISVFF